MFSMVCLLPSLLPRACRTQRAAQGLHFLVSYGYAELAEYFVSKRADTTIVNTEGFLALQQE